jgi:tripartite-type tricarboxylate transporter receptor subunit TctC
MVQEQSAFRRSCAAGAFAAAAIALALSGAPARAQQSVEDFYRGKNIDLVISYTAGGGYDAYARLVARYMGNHIPGKPNIIPRNMPGAGGRIATAYVYNVAAKDGTVLGAVDQSLPLEQVLGDKALQFDTAKFNWIGSPVIENNTIVTWHTAGIKTWEEAKAREVPVGATGANTSSQYPTAMNALVGTKFKVIYGYPGGNDVNLAMERGEVAGRGSNSWASWKGTRADWLRDKKINILVQIGLKKAEDLPDVPLLMDLGATPEDRAVLKLLSAPTTIGRPILTAPGVPPERVKALRAAFDATMKDPAFLEDAKKQSLDISPASGEELQQIVVDMIATPKPVVDRLVEIIGKADDGKR